MPRPTKGPRLGGSAQHERHMLANLATQLIVHESITTTEARARRLRPYVEKIITMKQTWQDALSAGSQVHHGYNPDVMPESLDAIAARMNTIGTADSQGAPVPHADQEPPRAWGPWQILAIVGGVLVGILIGAVLGRGKVRAARRRGTTHGTPPRGTRHSVRPHEARPYKDQRRRRRRAR